MVESSIVMKIRRQRLRYGSPCISICTWFTGATLAWCLLLGAGFRVSNLTGHFSTANSGTYFENSYQPDSAVTRLERQYPASDKSPPRQSSFGTLPNAVELAGCNVTPGRSLTDYRC